jgi:protein SCO1
MRAASVTVLGVLMTAVLAVPALGHSLKDLEADLGSRDKYFQSLGMGQEAPDFALEDADGRAVKLDDLRGKVVVLNFIYTSCPDLCPLHSERIAELQKIVDQAQMSDRVEFVSITTDPERDTPDVMRGYGAAHGLAPGNWVFLTSGPERPDATRELAARYGQKFTKGADGIEGHGVVTHVIDREGLWRAKFFGLKFDPVSALTYINALANDVHTAGASAAPEERSLWQRIEDSIASRFGLSG